MLISKKIINKYLNVDDLSIDELAKKITDAGFEVEAIDFLAQATNLVIGEVVECKPHEDSDHLNVCQVNVGQSENLQIVCGAPNCRQGLKVVVARDGAQLPNGVIKKGKIRGVESNGMLCALGELGVKEEHLSEEDRNGITELPSDAVVGSEDVLSYLELDDEILDIGLTPNRNDCLANFAFIKELGAILNREVKLPSYQNASNQGESTNLSINIDSDACTNYIGKIIRNVEVKESPKWIKSYLTTLGIQSVNNLVDIANLAMLATGQPLHFYDLDKLNSTQITVMKTSGKFVGIDGNEYELADDLAIMNEGRIIALAGVMGSDDTKVDNNTKNILIESASFNHVQIRNTARKFNLNTDAAIRFQKGIEPNAVNEGIDYACYLLNELVSNDMEVSVKTGSFNDGIHELTINLNNINKRLGTNFSDDEMIDVLTRLSLKPVVKDEMVTLEIPSYRQDLQIEADISEEIIRILGYDNLVATLPIMEASVGGLSFEQALRRKVKNILTNKGIYESITYSLVSEKVNNDAILPLEGEPVVLASPMSEDRKIMRASILPSLLNSVSYNLKRNNKANLMEISEVYRQGKHAQHLAIVLSDNLEETRWLNEKVSNDFYALKGLVELLFNELGINLNRLSLETNNLDTKHFHPYQSALIKLGKDLLGIMGKIHPTMAKEYGVSTDCVMLELDFDLLASVKTSKIKFKPISKYPKIVRDLAFVVKEDVPVSKIVEIINRNSNRLIKDIEIFDIYQGEHVEKGYKSVALSLTFQVDNRTLRDDEINEVCEKIYGQLENKLQAILRDK